MLLLFITEEKAGNADGHIPPSFQKLTELFGDTNSDF
jgi:hypothetical protein